MPRSSPYHPTVPLWSLPLYSPSPRCWRCLGIFAPLPVRSASPEIFFTPLNLQTWPSTFGHAYTMCVYIYTMGYISIYTIYIYTQPPSSSHRSLERILQEVASDQKVATRRQGLRGRRGQGALHQASMGWGKPMGSTGDVSECFRR